jgi:hypothetical protein
MRERKRTITQEKRVPVLSENGTPNVQATYNRGQEHLQNAMALSGDWAKEKMELCLQDFSWVWEESLEQLPTFVGVRGSFLLEQFKQLADIYPPALTYLQEQLGALVEHVEEGKAKARGFLDLEALHRTLGGDHVTSTNMHTLLGAQPEVADEVGPMLWRTWIAEQDWALVQRYPPSLPEMARMADELRAVLPPQILELTKTNPDMTRQLLEKIRLPRFDDILDACQKAGLDELTEELRAQEEHLRIF